MVYEETTKTCTLGIIKKAFYQDPPSGNQSDTSDAWVDYKKVDQLTKKRGG